jgi:hypothetical protein
MSADIVDLSIRRTKPRTGNGSREAMIGIIAKAPARCLGDWDAPACTDWILAQLWNEGFRIVPRNRDE